MDQRRSMSKMSGVVLYMVIGLILELMMMVLFVSGLVKLITVPKQYNGLSESGEEALWSLFILVGAAGGGIVFVTATIVLCCWWRKNKTKQFESEKLPIIPSNSAKV